ncbi:uncharacterized protein LOC110704126 [Chenopodium quinoa]|uniref:uncharacterized protein LOC110704126 n=1 Tax=Chenopodium quinoa TaxID=63459 RepID=UPI000B778942|nr:uncharacterized protein LOC110704126 [Chenopodium quinoa]
MCGEEEETNEHMLLFCPFVMSIWKHSVLRLDTLLGGNEGVGDWCNVMRGKLKDQSWWNIFWCLAWGVWLRRNAWVFERKRKIESEIIHKEICLVGEYEKSLEQVVIGKPPPPFGTIWKAPIARLRKLNSDVAIFEQQQNIGFGGILRDEMGDVLMACCGCVVGSFEVDVGEAMAMR